MVSEAKWLQTVLDENKYFVRRLKIRVKVGSGMGRIGLRDEKELQLLSSIFCSWVLRGP